MGEKPRSSFSVGVPDLDTFDVDRVEVLRGPQGTLFGSATLGGAVNYIPKGPRADAFEGRVEVGASSTTHTGAVNYGAEGMFNVPLMKDRLALRVVATTRTEPGSLDNIGVGKEGSTDLTVSGLRGELEWRPTAILEPFSLDTTVFSLRGQYNCNSASLPVNAAHTDKQQHLISDLTPFFGALLEGLVPCMAGPQDAFAKGDVFEARLGSLTAGGRYFDTSDRPHQRAVRVPDVPLLGEPLRRRAERPEGERLHAEALDRLRARQGHALLRPRLAGVPLRRRQPRPAQSPVPDAGDVRVGQPGQLRDRRPPGVFGGQTLVEAGTTLPMAAKWNAMASATYAWRSSLAPSVTASYRYVGSAPADLAASGTAGNYSLYDLRARLTALGIRWEVFVENLTDTRGVTTGWFTSPPNYVAYARPRMIGVRLIYDLK